MTAFKTALTFLALIIVIGMLLPLMGGCAEDPSQTCLRYGFKPGTDAYGSCLLHLEHP
jgi:hypothetical protein